LGLSPSFVEDQTVLAGVGGWGLFRSTDRGRLWTPSGRGLLKIAPSQILLSPGFARDHIALARAKTGEIYRSDDGGLTWQSLPITLGLLATSPEFEQDQTLMGANYDDSTQQTKLYLSRDGGYHWDQLAYLPQGVNLNLLTLAPLFGKWHVAFAFDNNGVLYRSSDGGFNWEAVLNTVYSVDDSGIINLEPAPGSEEYLSFFSSPPQLVIAPDLEVKRSVFFLVNTRAITPNPASIQGTLYYSKDGGLTWQVAQLPDNIVPTALAVSPDFARDGLLFLGTVDGQVKTWQPR
jgi:photosystem II stability/assembly factor-like uncharacterized protein